jgi:hypothetical protein
MTDLERKIDALITKMDSLVSSSGRTQNLFGSAPTSSTSATDAVTPAFKTLLDKLGAGIGNVFSTAAGYLDKSFQNTTSPQDLSNAITTTISQLGPGFKQFGEALAGVSSAVLDSYQNWQKFSGLGLQMGGDFLGLNTAIKQTGLTVEQFGEQFEGIGNAARSLGLGFSDGIKTFGEISKLQNDPKFAENFKLLGMLPKDVNSALTTVIRALDTVPKMMSNEQLMASTLALSREMDAMAKLTGKSRQEQEKTIEVMQNDFRFRAKMSELRETNPEGAAAAGELTKQMKTLDPAIANLLAEGIANEGVFNTEKIYEFQAVYGPEAANKMAQLSRNITSQDAEVRNKALQDSKTLMLELTEMSKTNRRFIAGGAVDNEFARNRFGGANNAYENLDKTMKALMSEGGGGMTKTQAFDEALRRANLEAEGLVAVLTKEMEAKNEAAKAEGKGPIYELGKKNPDVILTEVIGAVESNQQRFNVGLNEMVGTMATNVTKLVDMGKLLDTVTGYYKAGVDKNGKPIVKSQLTTTMEAAKVEITKMGELPENWADKISNATVKNVKEQVGGHRGGTMGKIGSWFDNFGDGTISVLHGNEGVFTPDQAEAFATQKFSNIIPNLSSLLRNVETKISSDSPVSSQVMEQLASGADAAMNLSAEKLDAISSLLAANLNELKEIARHTSNTSDNISNAGGYVS